MSESIRSSTLLVMEGTGYELHKQDRDVMIETITNHITGHKNKRTTS